MTFEIEYYNKDGILRTHSSFKVEKQNYYILHEGENEWLLCKDWLIGLLTLLHIPYSKLLNFFDEKENPIKYFPINETIIFAMRKDFWAKQAIKNWLENEKFILTKQFKSILLNQDVSKLNSDLQSRLSILLSDN